MIQNPTPITTSTFSGMWINQLAIFPETGKVSANFVPYDGTHLLATGNNRIFKSAPTGSLTNVVTKLQSLANKTIQPKLVQVSAPDPSKPVTAQVIFTDNSVYRIADCYALCATDSAFATVFQQTMGTVATLAGYTSQ